MRIIAYRHNENDNLGVMVGDENFVSLASVSPELPVKMMELLNISGWQHKIEDSLDG